MTLTSNYVAGPDSRVYIVAMITEQAGWARISHPGCGGRIELRNGLPDLPERFLGLMAEHVCDGPGWRGGRAVIVGDDCTQVICHCCATTWLLLPPATDEANRIRHEHRCSGGAGQFTFARGARHAL